MRFLLLLISLNVFAHEVGDFVEYDLDVSGRHGRMVGRIGAGLMAYDGMYNQYLLRVQQQFNGYPPEPPKDQWIKATELKTLDQIERLLKTCKPDDDTDRWLERRRTPAGVFDACAEEKINDRFRGVNYTGKVPLHGIIYQDYIDPRTGERIRLNLIRYWFASRP